MSSILVENENESTGDLNELKAALTEATADKAQAPADENALPEKYRGKTVEEVAEMHRNAESELGRRSNELGQYKQLTDRLLELKRREDLAKGGADESEIDKVELPKISSTELLEDPTGTIARLLEARDQTNSTRQQRLEAQRIAEEQQRAFAEAHPDADEIVKDERFLEWVRKSPARSLLGYQASNGDMAAGSALLTDWKDSQVSEADLTEQTTPAQPAQVTARPSQPTAEARRASTESAGQSRTPDAPTGKVYRRLDLIRLKLEDPEAYGDESFQREIMRAYAEGRVK